MPAAAGTGSFADSSYLHPLASFGATTAPRRPVALPVLPVVDPSTQATTGPMGMSGGGALGMSDPNKAFGQL